ncbi:MAG: hypothetical protein R2684_06855 [Pyrinomonadaceae bacterium]
MGEDLIRYEVTNSDLRKDKMMRYGAAGLPLVTAALPAGLFFGLTLLSGATPVAGMFLILSVISLFAGFILGSIGSGVVLYRRSKWLAELRDRIAADGIKTNEVNWFRKELKSEEKKVLAELESRNPLLGDAYRETLASRLTATRIIQSSGRELVLAKRRKNKIKYLNSEKLEEFSAEIDRDVETLSQIREDAREMEAEALSRLQMIEAAARRGSELAGTEVALKRLSERSRELPLALEAAKIEDEIRRELNEGFDELEEHAEDLEISEAENPRS